MSEGEPPAADGVTPLRMGGGVFGRRPAASLAPVSVGATSSPAGAGEDGPELAGDAALHPGGAISAASPGSGPAAGSPTGPAAVPGRDPARIPGAPAVRAGEPG